MYIDLLRLEKTICRWRLLSLYRMWKQVSPIPPLFLCLSAGTAAMDSAPSELRPEQHL